MNLKCMIGSHQWYGCTCTTCGKTREEGHDWSKDCEKCTRCGAIRNMPHNWEGCACVVCGRSRDYESMRDSDHVWGDGGRCKKCGKMLEYKFGNRLYIGNEIAELIHSMVKSVHEGEISRRDAVIFVLDVVEKLPKKMGWGPLQTLLNVVCRPREYIAPLYRAVKMKPDVYADFAQYVIGDYYMDLCPNYGDDKSCRNIDGMNALLDCLVDPRADVSSVAANVFKELQRSKVSGNKGPEDIYDIEGWRKWHEEVSRKVEDLREEVNQNKKNK